MAMMMIMMMATVPQYCGNGVHVVVMVVFSEVADGDCDNGSDDDEDDHYES